MLREAVDERTGRAVAVKELKVVALASADERTRWRGELVLEAGRRRARGK